MRKSLYLYFTAFIGGFVSLALELSAARLLAPTFGTTEIVWSAIIGLILLYLAIGYYIGGKWADRSPKQDTLYTILICAGCFTAIIPVLSRPFLQWAVEGMRTFNLGLLAGPFAVILALFTLPVTLLANVSPFVIRLAIPDVKRSGGTAGRIYAISTVGSFVGALLPNLVMIPNLGTWRTFIVLSVVCLFTGLGGLWMYNKKRFMLLFITVPLAIILFFLKPQTIKPNKGLIYEEETVYNYIQVIENTKAQRYLLLNEGQGIHSVYTPPEIVKNNPLALLTDGPWDYFLIAPFFNKPPYTQVQVKNMLVIGLAAGTSVTQFTSFFGSLPVDGVEIDPAIIKVGQQFFDMTQSNLDIYTTDGRMFLSSTDQKYSIIVIDAYRLPYIPWHLTTVEFFQLVYSHLAEDGTVAINTGKVPGNWRLVDALSKTLKQVFPTVHIIDIPDSFNAVVIATIQPTEQYNLQHNIQYLEDIRLIEIAERAVPNLRSAGESSLIFTDDYAPIEQLSHALIFGYVLGIE